MRRAINYRARRPAAPAAPRSTRPRRRETDMLLPAASASAPAGVFAPPLPGLPYAAALDPSIKFLLIGTACSATLIPLAVLLFFFSDAAFRRRPLFILNVLIIALGFVEGALNIYIQVRPAATLFLTSQ